MREKLLPRLEAALGWRWTPAVVIVAAVALALTCTRSGFSTDDWVHALRLDRDHDFGAWEHAPLDLFVFATGEPAERDLLMDSGQLAWWTAEDFQLAFWRPVTALTHAVDHALWPRSSVAMHLHGLLWFAALLAVLALLYRRFATPWVAGLGLLLFAVDDAHGPVLSFIANRSALVAAVFALLALLLHDRWRRDGDRRAAIAAPIALLAGLLAGEVATAVLGYLVGYALFVDRGKGLRRGLALAPAALVTTGWAAAHRALGYGARGGGVYTHPFEEPGRFVELVGERGPVLLFAELVGFPAEFWSFLPTGGAAFVHGAGVVVLLGFLLAMVPLLARRAEVRFWLFGGLLAVVPVCATLPADRLLLFVGIGFAPALAALLAGALEGTGEGRWRRAWRTGIVPVAIGIALVHLVLAPLLLPFRSQWVRSVSELLDGVDASIPSDGSVADRTLVVLNAPADGMVAYMPMARHVRGVEHPAKLRLLVTGLDEVHVARETPTSLRIGPEAGYWGGPLEQMVRGPARPVEVGHTVVLPGMLVEVTAVTPDGRAGEAVFRFDAPLEDPSLLWMRWEGRGLIPWAPPPVGTSEVLAPIDMGFAPQEAAQPAPSP